MYKYDYGLIFKVISVLLLSYTVIMKEIRITISFFILYGLGSIFTLIHLLNKKYKSKKEIKIYIYVQLINIITCLFTIYKLY